MKKSLLFLLICCLFCQNAIAIDKKNLIIGGIGLVISIGGFRFILAQAKGTCNRKIECHNDEKSINIEINNQKEEKKREKNIIKDAFKLYFLVEDCNNDEGFIYLF